MLKIRLQKPRKTKTSKVFDIVAIDSRKKRDGLPVEVIGSYTLSGIGKKEISLNKTSLLIRLSQGAVLSKSLLKILYPVLAKWSNNQQ